MAEGGSDEIADVIASVESEDEHPAGRVLAKLLGDGTITKDSYAACFVKFRRLHQAFQQCCAAEQQLLRRTRDLNKELKTQKQTIQSSSVQQQEHRVVLSSLREFVTNIQHELEAIWERVDQTRGNTALKRRERDRLRERVAKAQDDQLLKIEPQKRQVQVEIDALVQATAQLTATRESLLQQAQALQARLERADAQMSETNKRRRAVDQGMAEISLIPVKTGQRCAVVEAASVQLMAEERQVNDQVLGAESSLAGLTSTLQEQTSEHHRVSGEIDDMMRVVAEVRSKGEELKQQLAAKVSKRQNTEYEAKQISKMLEANNRDVSQLGSKIDALERDGEKLEREQARLSEAIARARHDIDMWSVQLHSAEQDAKLAGEQKASMQKSVDDAMGALEAAAKAVLSMADVSAETQRSVEAVMKENERRREIHDRLVGKERDVAMLLLETGIIRDRKGRTLAALKKRLAEHREGALELNQDLVDLARKEQEAEVRISECSALYEKVKLDRNRNVSHVQTARQHIVELREKVRILESEVSVLRHEFEQVDAAVKLQKGELTTAFNRRDVARSELKRAEGRCHALNGRIDLQQTELTRLSSALGAVERSVLAQKDVYGRQFEECSEAQQQLIDKRDQLCLMYEALNRHEEVLRRGEIALREREQECKMLGCQLADFNRQIAVLNRSVPQLRAYDAELSDIVGQVERERKEVERVTTQLETPELHERKRQYCGKDITLEELKARVAKYEQRINEKEQQLWERQILLREVNDKLGALHGSGEGNGLAAPRTLERRENLRTHAFSLRRKKRAALAEVAVYQANGDELKDEHDLVKSELQAAQDRSARGDEFDASASRMLAVAKRDLARASAPAVAEEDEEVKPGRPHFDAYPTADGLSRPYGGFPIFQPGPRSGHLRHYRQETVRAIEF